MGSILGLTLVVEIVISGFDVSTTSPPPPTGPPGFHPPCGDVTGQFGWSVAFWVRPWKTSIPFADRWLDNSLIL